MIAFVRTRTLRALRASLTDAEVSAQAARADADRHRREAATATDSAIRAETALEELRTEHAQHLADSARTEGELGALRALQLLDTEDRAVLRMLLRQARKTATTPQVFVLLRYGTQFHSVHTTREAAEKAAEAEGADPQGWLTQGAPAASQPRRHRDLEDPAGPAGRPMTLAVFFAGSALVALFGLCAVALHDVPRITGTVASIVTLAALYAALVR